MYKECLLDCLDGFINVRKLENCHSTESAIIIQDWLLQSI